MNMKKILQYTRVSFATLVLILMPMVMAQSCKNATPSVDGQAKIEAAQIELERAILEGDEEAAAEAQKKIDAEQSKANEGQARSWVDFVLGFVPAPEHMKKPLAAGVAAVGAQLCFERPRSNWKKAFAAMGRSVKEANPIGSKSEPGKAAEEIKTAVRSIGALVGLKHTTDDPDEVIANGQKLKQKLEAEGNPAA
tara:strand:+ start:3266 stop:3850 length:585 start_codon:yes stop_codon:yes gene_type:complete